ncbi:hypothetical protein C4R89_00945 [Clostridioides difficile]|nr:hypothetical protein [Clostridioides difficile]MDB0438104.1 hypothetical protein [Clostridioides difficile]
MGYFYSNDVKDKKFQMRLTSAQMVRLREISSDLNCSLSELFLKSLDYYLENNNDIKLKIKKD